MHTKIESSLCRKVGDPHVGREIFSPRVVNRHVRLLPLEPFYKLLNPEVPLVHKHRGFETLESVGP